MNSIKGKKQNAYIFWVVLFIITNLYLGHAKIIGDYSIRVPVATIIVLYTFQFKKFYRYNIFILLSAIYLIGSFLSTFVNNYSISEFISDTVISRFIFSIIFFYLVVNTKDIHRLTIYLTLILFTNTIFILGQFVDIELFWNLTNKLLIVDEEIFSKSYQVFTNTGLVEGIAGTVYSGYINVVLAPLSFYLYHNTNKKLLPLIFIVSTLFASLILQQRAALILVIVTSLLATTNFKKSFVKNVLIVGIVGIVISFSLNYFVENLAGISRLDDFSDISRITTLTNSINFSINNPLWGGFYDFMIYNNGASSHNLLFNAWIRGGIIGLIAIIILSTKVFIFSYKNILKNHSQKNLTFYTSVAMINLLFLSLTHNAGFTSGDFLHYGVLGLLLASLKQVQYK